MHRPRIGITCDIEAVPDSDQVRFAVRSNYADAVLSAGGDPVLLVPYADLVPAHISQCDGFVLTGGDDPAMEPFGVETDPRVTRVHPDRQQYETVLLQHLKDHHPDAPVLGVCLGMQMMALVDGGGLDQYMPDSMPKEHHWDAVHDVVPTEPLPHQMRDVFHTNMFPSGSVHSRHKQAVSRAGSLLVVASARDGVIEAVASPTRQFYLGVQWHPERTDNNELGLNLFQTFVSACESAVRVRV
ncbi:MAG: gamma-glutamyl-gamma-aminobutyrate hydrolase family protein [Phycisphaeraceae bacterium]|nr:gamma-glutamyl-gamma-aminobutyrate hydrolase family protein [Phycisphaerales bacterium]MCB9861559.1 gamma-glutamyl-gamma-aminobutyrate hydrolase family protein [Phycisphaeraceae bacterium]